MAAGCPRCGSAVALHEGKPFVTAAGSIELWHPSCWSTRHARGVEIVTVIAPRPHVPRAAWFAGVGAVAAILAIVAESAGLASGALGSMTRGAQSAPPSSLAVADLATTEQAPIAVREVARDEAPPAPHEHVPLLHGQPLDEVFTSLREWVHPVTDSKELVPSLESRWFGAERIGVERPECGAGHCGIDLDGPRGQPVVSVADGVVVRIERHELGLDGRSGRYVRIEHDDGALTAYMHLDDIAPGLQVGDRVDGGQWIGTLGATAVYSSAPHLHFSLEVPRRPGEKRGDRADTYYVDPAPFLARSTIVEAPDRRHGRKPAL